MMSIRDEELSALEIFEDNDVEFQEQQQPRHKTPGGSNMEGQPPYKKPRRVNQEPEPHSVAGRQITASEQCGTSNGSSQGGMASDVGPAVDSQPISSEESAGSPEEPPPVDLQLIRRYNRNYARFNDIEMYYEFKFVNLDIVHSFRDALLGMYSAVQRVLNNINNHIEPRDFVQLRLWGPGIADPFYSARRQAGHLNPETFLSAMSNLLQSYAQILADGALTLAAIVITPLQGAGLRHIKSIPYNSIIQKKRLHLIDVPMPNIALCFAVRLMAVVDERATTTQIKGAKKLYKDLGWGEQKEVSFADVKTIETHMKVNTVVVQWETSGWSVLKTPEQKCLKMCFLLLHDAHFYGVKNIKGFFGSRNFCYVCYTPYAHSHDCLMNCHRCLDTGCVKRVGRIIICPECKVQCRSQDCLGRHKMISAMGRVECIPH
ncbi:uncharacterized protein LOC128342397 [Hemicordylus capensis]|uniref:uncharacterized protein LOC128342397 n=1 Tax=Hemicordylus capensis TaxID=884348 RepID=UPI0023039EFB|nr:uncharacterized protein LOC128342397 [Hemicordylus capensis]